VFQPRIVTGDRVTVDIELETNSTANETLAEATGPAGPQPRVHRRRLFYIGGFDPRSVGYYHGLYAEHGGRQAALAGAAFEVGPRRNQGRRIASWTVTATYGGETTETDYRFLRWDDLVRARWKQSELKQLYEVWRCFLTFLRTGVLGMMALKGPATAASGVFPMLVTTAYLAAFSGLVIALSTGLSRLAHALDLPGWAAIVGLVLPLGLFGFLRAGWRWIDQRLAASWLNRCFTYMMDSAKDASEAEARCAEFAEIILSSAGDETIDEILLVGHSQGTLHAVRTAARILRRDPSFGRGRTRFSLLTLGQPFAVYTPLPNDANLQRDLAEVAASDALVWLDETSPGDPVSSCGVDPLHGLDIPGRLWPIRKSPRFHLLMTKANFRRIKLRPLDFHFQYLMAGDIPGAYDYFRMTAGPDFLREPAAA
jgi:hypothetical protein